MDLWRVCVWLPGETDTARNGHPAFVWPRQGHGRVDDPEHDYLVLYLGDSPVGAIAEYLGDYARWTPAVLEPPPAAPTGSRLGLARYTFTGSILDLDDPEVLSEWALRPSSVVTRDRGITQRWARAIHDSGEYAGVSWWSHRDPRWASLGVWDRAQLRVSDEVEELTLVHPALIEASHVISRVVET
ncbi:RES family NAD+ phosphorylase [Geodermatophilus sp. YIM 151500]|uniref:RES family NAD+ phosphorylase n=1 Tax=Geodermatophilus sp. YIM 151500 TaxID=2984531 RepID=UPI0021E49C4E|nr:RES family NAD+ phosphorylase [Geodermatophilus sp. YIM 151500]MCV2489442.1 RES family NAD+ phosphorylase [Geodermatophilus sp. YIM 151500]